MSSKYGLCSASRVFVPTSFFQLLLGHILCPTDNCLVKHKKVKNVLKLLPPHNFKYLMTGAPNDGFLLNTFPEHFLGYLFRLFNTEHFLGYPDYF